MEQQYIDLPCHSNKSFHKYSTVRGLVACYEKQVIMVKYVLEQNYFSKEKASESYYFL